MTDFDILWRRIMDQIHGEQASTAVDALTACIAKAYALSAPLEQLDNESQTMFVRQTATLLMHLVNHEVEYKRNHPMHS